MRKYLQEKPKKKKKSKGKVLVNTNTDNTDIINTDVTLWRDKVYEVSVWGDKEGKVQFL